jgi:hypothetical protein
LGSLGGHRLGGGGGLFGFFIGGGFLVWHY